MKLGLLMCALTVMLTPAAYAADRGMTIADVYNFTAKAQGVINSPNLNVTQNQLSMMIAEYAQFSDQISAPTVQYQPGWNNVAYEYGYNNYNYYRYPYRAYSYAPVSYRALSKNEEMGLIWNKKQLVPGYHSSMDITHVEIGRGGDTAMVDMDVREYGMAYNGYNPGLTQQILHSNSKCRMYLRQTLDDTPMLTRMDCNTNSNLPM